MTPSFIATGIHHGQRAELRWADGAFTYASPPAAREELRDALEVGADVGIPGVVDTTASEAEPWPAIATAITLLESAAVEQHDIPALELPEGALP